MATAETGNKTFAFTEAEDIPVALPAVPGSNEDEVAKLSNCEILGEEIAGCCLRSIECCKQSRTACSQCAQASCSCGIDSCIFCASIPVVCVAECCQCMSDFVEDSDSDWGFCCFCCCVVPFVILFILSFHIPLWVEEGLDCSEFVPSGGISSNIFSSSDIELVEYYSSAKVQNYLSENDFFLEAHLEDSKGKKTDKGNVCKIDKNNGYESCTMCTSDGVCSSLIDGFRVDEELSYDLEYKFTMKIEVAENITLLGGIEFPDFGLYKATYQEPEFWFTLNDQRIRFPSGDSKAYRYRINFEFGNFNNVTSGNSQTRLWPGASIYQNYVSFFEVERLKSRYCVPQVKNFDLNDFLDQAPSDTEIIEAVLQGETLAHVQFLIRQASLLSRHGYVAYNNLEFWLVFVFVWQPIIFCACIMSSQES